MANKGANYEREVCRKLSLWASSAEFDDWFWRSSQSGGRATQRAKSGKRTIGHESDVAATCPEGSVLTNLVSFEIKRGYNKYPGPTLYSLLDLNDKAKTQTVETFIQQARDAAVRAKTLFWAVIHRLDRRESVIYSTLSFFNRFVTVDIKPRAIFKLPEYGTIMAMPLDRFLYRATPPKRKMI